MDNRIIIMNSICENLAYHKIAVSQHMQSDMLNILQNYRIVQEPTVPINDMPACIHQYIMAKKIDGLSVRTLKNYSIRLKFFSNYINMRIDEITVNEIRNYLAYLTEERHFKESSLSTEINILRAFFSWLCMDEIIKKNPMQKIKAVKFNKKKLRSPLSVEEIERIRNCYKDVRDKAIFEFFYSSGCRLSEAIAIDVSDINFYERSVVVIGKGSKERTVYFSTRSKIFIQEYLQKRKGESNALFISKVKPYKRIKSRIVHKDIQRLGRSAELKSRTFPHILRHSFASHALNSGMDINILQALLGHEDINTTQIYASINNATVRNEYNKLIF